MASVLLLPRGLLLSLPQPVKLLSKTSVQLANQHLLVPLQECFSFAVYTSQYQFGMCREWLDQAYHSPHSLAPRNQASALCDTCGRHANCSSCLRTLGCGWCYDLDNPIQGVCVSGDFSNPASGESLISETQTFLSLLLTNYLFLPTIDTGSSVSLPNH